MPSRARTAQRLAEITPRVLPSLVVLELDDRLGAAFVVAEDGLIATCLHVVTGEPSVIARFADGRQVEVLEIAAIDARRDLILLRIDAKGLPALPLSSHEMVEGTSIFVPRAEDSTLVLQPNKVGGVRTEGDSLAVYSLVEEMSSGAAGAPVLDEEGALIGMLGASPSESGPIGVGIPLRYLAPLLTPREASPLSLLARGPRRRRIKRSVPEHPTSLLDGSNPQGLREIRNALVAAINVGAPTYNRGDFEGCVKVYGQIAQRLITERPDCPGAQTALREGLDRVTTLEDPDAQAWAMRDTFDGLLHVIERWFENQDPPSGEPDKSLLN